MNLTDGQSVSGSKVQLGTTGSYYQVNVTRLNRYIYLLRSVGTYEVGSNVAGSRTMAMIVKRYMPEMDVNSGAIVVGDANVQGSVTISGGGPHPDRLDRLRRPGAR